MKLWVNLGRSVSGIVADAVRQFSGAEKCIVIAVENDPLLEEFCDSKQNLPLPTYVLTVGRDGGAILPTAHEDVTEDDIFVLNGGRTPQQAAMWSLTGGGTWARLVDLQPDNTTFLAPLARARRQEVEAFHELWKEVYWYASRDDGDMIRPRDLRQLAEALGLDYEAMLGALRRKD